MENKSFLNNLTDATSFISGEKYGPLEYNTQEIVDNISEILEARESDIQNQLRILKRKNKKLESRICIDSLTRITNRGKFDILLNKLMKKGENFSLLFFDIDHFKQVNDKYGHLSGDFVLKEVVMEVKSKIKSSDIFARYGGEEFIIVLPGTNIEGGEIFSQRIRKIIEEMNIIDKVGNEIKITISIGVVEKKESDSVNSLLDSADKALYQAKDLGRNRVVSIHRNGNLFF